MNGYLVPANSKKGTLILNIFRPVDLIMFGIGMGVTLLILLIFSSEITDSTLTVIIACLPGGIAGLLVLPIPYYHNVLCAIQSIYRFYSEKRNYYWKGWCFYEQFGIKKK